MCGGLECVTHHLKESTHPVIFQQNQVDIFTVQSLYLGNLESVTIWHDGSGRLFSWSGFLSTWFLENIRIIETLSGMEQTFTCSCWVYGNDPKTLYPQNPRSCDSSYEREPKKPQVPIPLMGTPLLSCEIQNPPRNKFSLLWMFRSTEGHNRVIAAAGTRADILAPCLGKSKQRNHGMLEPGQNSCPESTHCLLPPSGVTRNDLERYWCLIGPGEDVMWGEQVLSVLSFTPVRTRTLNESTSSE
uniref:PLAT domain-containing protein n=1 Tax=Eptatretus burgeri TaxID=7764 RepID=A0A8C4X1S8_EPTBU